MTKILTLLLLNCCFISSFSQRITIKGRISDPTNNRGLSYTTVSLVKAADSTLVTFARADSAGNFIFNGIETGSYLIAASYAGYLPVWYPVTIPGTAPVFDIGPLFMKDLKTLDSVTVTDKRPPVTIVNDTLEFNTENFKTLPNAVVEDMLKKMPGITIENDGSIKINGQTVRRVLVNGKEFFTGDPRMATKNLSADAVDKVQVFDKKSDQSEFTGLDDGNREKTINLKLKKDKANALFGRTVTGIGAKGKYDAQANINKFNGDEQLSFLGMANNTNRQGFTLTDAMNFSGELSRGMRSGGGIMIRNNDDDNGLPVTGLGQNQQGVATTYAGGVNYNNTWNKKRSDFNSSYTASNIHLRTNKETFTQNLLPQNPFNGADSSNSLKEVTQHRFNFTLDQKLDTFTSFKMTPSITFQNNQSFSNTIYNTLTNKKTKLNDGYSLIASNANALNFTNNILFRRRFMTKGRTISANLSMTYNHSDSKGKQQSRNSFYDAMQIPLDSFINQRNDRHAVTKNVGVNIIYTEPAGKHSLFEFSSYYNINAGESDKKTFDYNPLNDKYDTLNQLLSNYFKTEFRYAGGGIRFRTNKNKTTFSAGAQLQHATLRGTNFTYKNNIRQTFSDVLPNLSYQYQFSRMKTLRFDYNTSISQPSIMQLQPVADVSNPLNITVGNPGLTRQFNHSLSLNYFGVNMAARKNLFLLINANLNQSAIVSADEIKNNGSRVTRPVNANGVYNIFGNINYGFPIRKLKSRLELESNFVYYHTISFLNDNRSIIKNLSVGPRVNYNFDIDTTVSLQLAVRVTYNHAKYLLQRQLNNDYFQQTYSIDLTNYLMVGLVLNNQFSYVLNTGRASGFNTSVPLWNASIAKGFMKNKRAELKLSVFDVLNKNIGVTRSVNQNYIVDQRYNVLTRYCLLSFTYSLNRSGLNSGPRAVLRRIGE